MNAAASPTTTDWTRKINMGLRRATSVLHREIGGFRSPGTSHNAFIAAEYAGGLAAHTCSWHGAHPSGKPLIRLAQPYPKPVAYIANTILANIRASWSASAHP